MTRGSRISILGLWQPDKTFEYALAQGGFNGESYIQVMDWIAQKAALTLHETGRLTVIAQDNSHIKSKSHFQARVRMIQSGFHTARDN